MRQTLTTVTRNNVIFCDYALTDDFWGYIKILIAKKMFKVSENVHGIEKCSRLHFELRKLNKLIIFQFCNQLWGGVPNVCAWCCMCFSVKFFALRTRLLCYAFSETFKKVTFNDSEWLFLVFVSLLFWNWRSLYYAWYKIL